MKKRILLTGLCMVLAFATVFVMSSCGNEKSDEDKNKAETEEGTGKEDQGVKVSEIGFNTQDGTVNYAVKVENTNKETEFAVATVKIKAETKDGKEVFETEQDVSIFPGDNFFVGNEKSDKAGEIDKITAEVKVSDEDKVKNSTALKDMFKIDNVKEDAEAGVISGDIAPLFTPNSNNPTGSAIVLLYDKDKKLVGGQAAIINLVGKDKPVEFKVETGKVEHDSFQVVGYTSTYEVNEDE